MENTAKKADQLHRRRLKRDITNNPLSFDNELDPVERKFRPDQISQGLSHENIQSLELAKQEDRKKSSLQLTSLSAKYLNKRKTDKNLTTIAPLPRGKCSMLV